MPQRLAVFLVVLWWCVFAGAAEQRVALPDLRKELLERRERDQAIRSEVNKAGVAPADPDALRQMREIDRENTARMKEIVREHGWPGPDLIGRDGVDAAWLIVQHSTPEFQGEMLPLIEAAYRAGKVRGESYALLKDRVLVHEGRPQIYGSQGRRENGVLKPYPIEDEANVDQRRAEVGLGPLAEYLDGLRRMYGARETAAGAATVGAKQATAPRRALPQTPLARLMEAEQRAEEAVGAWRAAATAEDKAKQQGTVSLALQQLAWARSVAGDHAGAIEAFRRVNNPLGEARASGVVAPEKVAETLAGFRASEAIAAIVEAARERQVVILNEAHHVARHRSFALQLARELRKLGFQYLACEGFSGQLDAERLRQRGYPLGQDGYYLGEPLFADLIRESLRLGFVPVAYENVPGVSNAKTQAEQINERETGQATNLMERIFKQNPQARVFIYCGFSHLRKTEQKRATEPNLTVEWMARRLRALSGIEPLTIDQTAMTEPAKGTLEAALLAGVFVERRAEGDSVVMKNERGESLVLGSYKGDVDLQVWHAPERVTDGRATWLAGGGYRAAQAIPRELLPTSGRRLVQAFREGEMEGAVAVDQVLVRAGEAVPVLMLPEGRYRYAFEE